MSKVYTMTDTQFDIFTKAKSDFDAGLVTFDANPYVLCAGEYPFTVKGETYLTVFNRVTSDLELYHFNSDTMRDYNTVLGVSYNTKLKS